MAVAQSIDTCLMVPADLAQVIDVVAVHHLRDSSDGDSGTLLIRKGGSFRVVRQRGSNRLVPGNPSLKACKIVRKSASSLLVGPAGLETFDAFHAVFAEVFDCVLALQMMETPKIFFAYLKPVNQFIEHGNNRSGVPKVL